MSRDLVIRISSKAVFATAILLVLFVLFVGVSANSDLVLNFANPPASSVPTPGHSSVDVVVNVSGAGACNGNISLQQAVDNGCFGGTGLQEGIAKCTTVYSSTAAQVNPNFGFVSVSIPSFCLNKFPCTLIMEVKDSSNKVVDLIFVDYVQTDTVGTSAAWRSAGVENLLGSNGNGIGTWVMLYGGFLGIVDDDAAWDRVENDATHWAVRDSLATHGMTLYACPN